VVTASVHRLKSRSLPVRMPLDALVRVDIDPASADIYASVSSPRRKMATATARVDARFADLFHGKVPDWELNGDLEIHGIQLQRVVPVDYQRVEGLLTGWVSIAHLNRPEMRTVAELSAKNLFLGDAEFERARIGLRADAGKAEVEVGLAQVDGYARVEARVPTRWSGGGVAVRQGTRVDLRARAFDLAAIHPFVEDIFGDIGGRLDGKATLDLGKEPHFSGKLTIADGCWQVADYGETFTDTNAEISFEKSGVVRLHRFRATSLSGELNATGQARFDGFGLKSGNLDLRIPRDRPLPVVVAGQHFGEAYGHIEVKTRMLEDRLEVRVGVPELDVTLAKRLPQDSQELKPSENIHIGTRKRGRFTAVAIAPPKNEEVEEDPLPIEIRLALGDVVVRQTRTVYAELSGSPRFLIEDEVEGRGTIRISSGRLDVQGKELEVTQGVITFTGQPIDNPLVNVTAKWVAPDGTEVFADFIGPVKTGKVTLRSNPPLSRDEIVATLLFGSPDGYSEPAAGTEPDRATQAVGLGGSIVANGLNEAIDDLTSLDIGVRVDTSRPGAPEPELEVRLARTLSLQISHLLGVPGPGESPDRNFATLSWRFLAEWVLETRVGDHGGTSADIVWQHRY
jgi:translocation and assembly module TamB